MVEQSGASSGDADVRHRRQRSAPHFPAARHALRAIDKVKDEFLITKDKQVLVHDGQVVNKGEMIVDGPVDPQDILRLLGIEAPAR